MTSNATMFSDSRFAAFLRAVISPRWAVVVLLVALLIAIAALNPSFVEPGQFIRFIQRVAPIAIVAVGQYFVIVSGEFDLSMGSLVTAQVVIAGTLIKQDDSRVIPVLCLMIVIGIVVGLVNGIVTTLLKVPSFIVTLGTMLAIYGGVLWWTGGAATGNPTEAGAADRPQWHYRCASGGNHPLRCGDPHCGHAGSGLAVVPTLRSNAHRTW